MTFEKIFDVFYEENKNSEFLMSKKIPSFLAILIVFISSCELQEVPESNQLQKNNKEPLNKINPCDINNVYSNEKYELKNEFSFKLNDNKDTLESINITNGNGYKKTYHRNYSLDSNYLDFEEVFENFYKIKEYSFFAPSKEKFNPPYHDFLFVRELQNFKKGLLNGLYIRKELIDPKHYKNTQIANVLNKKATLKNSEGNYIYTSDSGYYSCGLKDGDFYKFSYLENGNKIITKSSFDMGMKFGEDIKYNDETGEILSYSKYENDYDNNGDVYYYLTQFYSKGEMDSMISFYDNNGILKKTEHYEIIEDNYVLSNLKKYQSYKAYIQSSSIDKTTGKIIYPVPFTKHNGILLSLEENYYNGVLITRDSFYYDALVLRQKYDIETGNIVNEEKYEIETLDFLESIKDEQIKYEKLSTNENKKAA